MPIAASVSAVPANSASRNVTNRGCDNAARHVLHRPDVGDRKVAVDQSDRVADWAS